LPPIADLLDHVCGEIGSRLIELPADRRKPRTWTADHVGERLTEAFRALRRLPMSVRPKGYDALWPAYVHEAGEGPRNVATADVRRARFGSTADDLSRMHEALSWPMEYLGHDTELARAVNEWAPSNGAEVNEQRNERIRGGLLTIAVGLSRKKTKIR
jgi:hypothetical protein